MTEAEHYKVKGYIALLETAEPNGRLVHRVRNKITVLRLQLYTGMPIAPAYETEIKALIRELYFTRSTKKYTL